MRDRIETHWPILVALIALWVIMAMLTLSSLQQTRGHLIYTLDDAYIHMAMAKNISQHGVYGVTKYEFSSSSSSPVWTLLLASFYVVIGIREWMPFVLNVLLASTILVAIYFILRRAALNTGLMFIALLAVAFFTPFPAMIFCGMEHLLHILLTIVCVWYLSEIIVKNDSTESISHFAMLCVLFAGMLMTRFESYSLLLVGCVLLLVRKKWKRSLVLAFTGILPLFLYQYISVSKGWFWLPNSILIRADPSKREVFNSQQAVVVNSIFSGFSVFFLNGLRNFECTPYISVLIVTSCALLVVGWVWSKSLWTNGHIMLVLFILAALAHLQFGKIGHFFRYEAYLIALGLFVIAYASSEIIPSVTPWKQKLQIGIVIGVIGLYFSIQGLHPLIERSRNSYKQIPLACRNIYEQQYQMGLFLRYFYPGSTVAVNDIGAVSFLGDVHLLDLVGLASADVLKLKTEGFYTTQQIHQLSRNKDVAIAIVYDTGFQLENLQGVPSEWIKVGEWKINDNVVCGGNVVSFYAVKASEEKRLMHNLRLFSNMLPGKVGQFGLYTNSNDSSNAVSEP
ncbi:MAG: hypothetical protein ABSA44_07715 [Bacteroidota bacterium]|jgi:hypothetical protein